MAGALAAGLHPPTRVRASDAEVIEEAADHVIVRLPGFMRLPQTPGGMFFGGHVLRKHPLRTFNKPCALRRAWPGVCCLHAPASRDRPGPGLAGVGAGRGPARIRRI